MTEGAPDRSVPLNRENVRDINRLQRQYVGNWGCRALVRRRSAWYLLHHHEEIDRLSPLQRPTVSVFTLFLRQSAKQLVANGLKTMATMAVSSPAVL